MKVYKIRFCAFLLLFSAFLCLFVYPVKATSTFSLGIFPPIIEIIAKPGSQVKAKLRIINYGDSISLKVYPQMFRAADEMGNIEPLESRITRGVLDGALKWVTLESKSQILPGEIKLLKEETRDFNLILNIPQATPESDHYLTIFFELIPFGPLSMTQAKNLARIGANLLLTVSDRAILPKYGEVVEFSSPKFVESGPVHFTLRVKNNSRSFFKPLGEIKIYNTLMKETGEIGILPQNILAGTIRQLTDKSMVTQIKNQNKKVLGVSNQKSEVGSGKLDNDVRGGIFGKIVSFFSRSLLNTKYLIPNTTTPTLVFPRSFLLGRYTAVASFSLDENGPTLTAKTTFYAFPIRLTLAVLLVILLLLIIKKRLKT